MLRNTLIRLMNTDKFNYAFRFADFLGGVELLLRTWMVDNNAEVERTAALKPERLT